MHLRIVSRFITLKRVLIPYNSYIGKLLLLIHAQGAGDALLHICQHPLRAEDLFLALNRIFSLSPKALMLWYLCSSYDCEKQDVSA